jgi:isopenicillin-N epimerase
VLDAVLARVSARTRLAVLDHVTSQTALVFPIASSCRELESRGVDVLVDGAHAPRMVDVDIAALSPAYYAGELSQVDLRTEGRRLPLGARRPPARRAPRVISHGAKRPGPARADASGSSSSGWAPTTSRPRSRCPPRCASSKGSCPAARAALRARNRELALAGRRVVADGARRAAALPRLDDRRDGVAARARDRPLPGAEGDVGARARPAPRRAVPEHRIEVPVLTCPAHPERLLRISAQAYNSPADYDGCAAALRSAPARPSYL